MPKWLLLCAVILLPIITSKPVVAEEVWRITSLNWEPYSGAQLPGQGASIQALRALLQPHGIRLEVEFYPWRRAQMLAQSEGYIGYFPAWPEEVQPGFVGSSAIDYSHLAIIKRSNQSLHFSTLDALFREYRIGLVKTYVYPHYIADLIEKYPEQVIWAETEKALMRKLSIGRHPVAITDPKVMRYQVDQEQLPNIELHSILEQTPLVIALRNQDDNYIKINRLQSIIQQKLESRH